MSSKQSNFFFFSNRTNRNSICFGCFSVCFAKPKLFFCLFRFVLVFRTGIETTKTNRKKLQKTFSIRGSSKPLIFFLGSNQNKPKLNLFWLFFGLLFCKTTKFFFSVCFDVSDWYQNNLNKRNFWYGELKRLIF